jgi:DNA-binding Lrp family transcriptional regulator
MDDIDRAILMRLSESGRLPNNELADLIGLSPSPCLRRVRKLEADGVIQGYGARLDRDAIGCGYEVLVWVTLSSVTRTTLDEFETAVADVSAVTEALRMMGQPDYLMRVTVADQASFEATYLDDLARLPHIQTLTSQLAMKVIKRSLTPPLGKC